MPDNYITLSQLTKTTKGLVNKINTESTVTNNKIGNLTNLNTNAKTNLVAAINEAAASGTAYDDTALAGRVTALENAGYITSYTETDPTVPSWAKQSTKPTYTAAEVGALPDTTVIPAAQVNADWDATSGVAQILHKPTIPNVPAWALAASKPTYTATEVGALPSTYTAPVTSVNGQTGAVNLTIPAATTVTNTLASGTLIATINGTNIYAPAYTDADGVSY